MIFLAVLFIFLVENKIMAKWLFFIWSKCSISTSLAEKIKERYIVFTFWRITYMYICRFLEMDFQSAVWYKHGLIFKFDHSCEHLELKCLNGNTSKILDGHRFTYVNDTKNKVQCAICKKSSTSSLWLRSGTQASIPYKHIISWKWKYC